MNQQQAINILRSTYSDEEVSETKCAYGNYAYLKIMNISDLAGTISKVYD